MEERLARCGVIHRSIHHDNLFMYLLMALTWGRLEQDPFLDGRGRTKTNLGTEDLDMHRDHVIIGAKP
jgi:hypothetical protein